MLLTLTNGILLQNGKDSRSNGCPDGWTEYLSHCYYYGLSEKSWKEAKITCEQFGGHLVTIEDKAEDNFIESFIQDRNTYTWMGASDLAEEGKWLWVTDIPFNTSLYLNWRRPGPNNKNNEDCMDWSFSGWNDNTCSRKLNFVCENESNRED